MKRAWIYFVVALVPFLLLSHTLFLDDPPVSQDEALLFDSSYNLAMHGKLATNLVENASPGIRDLDVSHPPLYYYLLAGWIKVFGPTLETARALSVVTGVAALIIFFLIAGELFPSVWQQTAATTLLSIDFFFGGATRTARMDIVGVAFILSAVYFYLKKIPWATGIFLGLAILTHPAGLLALVFLCIDVAIAKKWNTLAPILCIPVIMLCLWFLSLGSSFPVLVAKTALQLALKNHVSSTVEILVMQNDCVSRLLIGTTLLTLVLAGIDMLKKKSALSQFLTISFGISLIGVYAAKEQQYFVYFVPFLILVIINLIGVKRRVAWLALAGFLWTNIWLYSSTIARQNDPDYRYHRFTKLVAENIPNHATVLISGWPDPYFDLRKNPTLTLLEAPEYDPNGASYQVMFHKADYVIVNTVTPALAQFLQDNTAQVTNVSIPGGYGLAIIRLVPKNKRL